MTDRAPAGGTLPMACPFLALDEDRDRRSAVPDGRHRCYAEPSPQPRALTYQEAYCLSPAFSACRSFLDWAARAAAEPMTRPVPGAAAGVPPLAPIPGMDAAAVASDRSAPTVPPAPPTRLAPPDPPAPSPSADGLPATAGGTYPWVVPPPWVAQPGMRSTATLPDSARPPLDAERLGPTAPGATAMLPPPPLDEETGAYPEWPPLLSPGRVTGTFGARRSEPFTPAGQWPPEMPSGVSATGPTSDAPPVSDHAGMPIAIRVGDGPERSFPATAPAAAPPDVRDEPPSGWLATFLTDGPPDDPIEPDADADADLPPGDLPAASAGSASPPPDERTGPGAHEPTGAAPVEPTGAAPVEPTVGRPAGTGRGRPGVPVDADAPRDTPRQARPSKRPRGSGEWEQRADAGPGRVRRRLIPTALPPVALAALLLFLGAGLLFLAPGLLAGPPPTPAPTADVVPGGLIASARPGVSLPPRTTEPPSTEFETYVVKGGDTLIDIARRFAISQEALICANRQLRRNPNLLSIGQELQIPPEDWQCPSPPKPTKKP